MSGAVPRSLIKENTSGKGPVIRAAHGDDDPLIPIDAARATVKAFQAAGFDVRLTEFAGLGHGVDRRMRAFLYKQLGEMTSASAP